jgi:hypothetical protein
MHLRTLLTLVVGLLSALALAALTLAANSNLDTYRSETAETAVRIRSQALGAFLTRSLHEEWQQIERSAADIQNLRDADALQQRIDAMGSTDEKLSWLGVAAADGTVLASSRGMLRGENVAQRPWFQQGLVAPFAGDVHEAVLLARLMQSEGDEPLRFVDFAAPIRNADGEVIAVLGAHVNWRWARTLVEEAARLLELDVFIVNRDGTIVLSTAAIDERTTDMNSILAARRGVRAVFEETWPDGLEYQSFTVPDLTYGSLPPFGWGLVARLDPTVLSAPQQRFQTQLALGAALATVFIATAFALISGSIVRPLRRIAGALLAQVKGEPSDYVREHRRYKEVQTLSEVLARLQSDTAVDRR